jgi:hypothetical protein
MRDCSLGPEAMAGCIGSRIAAEVPSVDVAKDLRAE